MRGETNATTNTSYGASFMSPRVGQVICRYSYTFVPVHVGVGLGADDAPDGTARGLGEVKSCAPTVLLQVR